MLVPNRKYKNEICCFFLIVCTIYSCNENTIDNSRDNFPSALNTISVTDDKDIFGKWSMCAESDGQQMFQYNMCSTIIFNIDGSGSKINPNGVPATFSWTFKNKALKIYQKEQSFGMAFPDTNYVAVLSKKENLIRLEIRQVKENYAFFLQSITDDL